MKSLHLNLEKLGEESMEELLEELQEYNDNDNRRIYLEEFAGGYHYSIDPTKPSAYRIGIHKGADLPFIEISRWKELIRERLKDKEKLERFYS